MLINNNILKIKRFSSKIFRFLRFFFLFSIDKIEKRTDLYELREQFIFFKKIFKINAILERILFFSFNNYFNFFQKMFFSVANNIEKKLKTPNMGKIQLKPFSNFFLNNNENIFFRAGENKVDFSELVLKNYILFIRRKFLEESMFKIHSFPLNSLTFTLDIEKKLKLIGFSKNLLKKLFFIFYSNFKTLLKKKNYISRDFEQKFFYLEELLCFFKTNLAKTYLCEINKMLSFEKFFYLGKIREYKKNFESKKFLKKLLKLKKIKKPIFHRGMSFKPQIRNKDSLNFFTIYKNKCIFSPKIKGQKLFLELYQKNLNLYWEFERLKIKLFSFLYLKIHLKNKRLSTNIYIYHLILFKILNLINVFNSRVLNLSFILEKKIYQFDEKTNLSYSVIKKTFFQSNKTCVFKNSSYFENEHIYLLNLKLTQVVNSLLDKIKVKTNVKKDKSTLSFSKILLKPEKKIKNDFLKEISNWDSILHNRLNFFVFFFSDSSILDKNIRVFQFNGFDFRKTGF